MDSGEMSSRRLSCLGGGGNVEEIVRCDRATSDLEYTGHYRLVWDAFTCFVSMDGLPRNADQRRELSVGMIVSGKIFSEPHDELLSPFW